jgi:uncharacterized protein (UPF0261 family)
MGGSGGSSVFAAAIRDLPIGFPKVLVTTLASGDTRELVGTRDLVLVPSVVDISGLNRISRMILSRAAGAVCGMVASTPIMSKTDRPLIAASMLGNSTQAIDTARKHLEAAGYEVLVFHAVGTGGRTMEALIADRYISGVFDITTTELASELVGAPSSAGPDRLRTAGRLGIPQVIAPGCMDFSIFWGNEPLPSQYADRLHYRWNPVATLLRSTPDESTQLGRQLAERANESRGPVAVFLPLGGLSLLDIPGQPFWWPEADATLFTALREHLRPDIPLVELDTHINDPDFAHKAVEKLLELMASTVRWIKVV